MKETLEFVLPEFNLEKVSCVYVGKPHKCMCGCSGKYAYTRANRIWSGEDRGYAITDNEIDDKEVQRVINKVRNNQILGIEVLDDYIYTVVIGNTCYTIYLGK